MEAIVIILDSIFILILAIYIRRLRKTVEEYRRFAGDIRVLIVENPSIPNRHLFAAWIDEMHGDLKS